MSVQSVAALPDHRPDRVTGARVARLKECIAAADDAQRAHIAEEFWQEAAARGTPLVEELDGEPDHRAVTFLWRGHRATRQVLLMVSHLGDRAHLAGSLMEQVPGTDIWHFGLRLRADHRASYRIAADVSAKEPPADPEVLQARLRSLAVHAAHDPLNLRRLPTRWGAGDNSVFALPEAPAPAWTERRGTVPTGRVERHRIGAAALGGDRDVRNERDVWVYLPPGSRGDAERPGPRGDTERLPVLVLCDGDMWFGRVGLQHTLDSLIADGLLPPLAVLAPDAVDRHTRNRELGARDPFVEFLADELLPWAAGRWPLATDPARTVVAGQSLGGLAALHAGRLRPDRFGHVVAQSPSLWWRPTLAPGVVQKHIIGVPWLAARYAETDPAPITVHLDAGLHEGTMVDHCRALYDTLHSARYEVTRNEFNGGHDYACWHVALVDVLIRLLGAGPDPA
ncbi:enterochelin esterase [Streptomyces sp. NBC_00006]|uniref:enterochelin esterase n=1 Tax=Streptomyces sp. NBC_00006 TaxID=2975619 RepID=UPI002250BE0E|nr:enterochelin esterase [Streptomyces sp. NBC_00006]MCX5534968.1 enterochelin esterase [Streptomyces sp. NBC_00006]